MKAAGIISFLSVVAAVAADSCNNGGWYCGASLLQKGNYRDHIISTLATAQQPFDEVHIQNSRFHCVDNGDIVFDIFCSNGCTGVGSDADDSCLT